MREIVSVFGSWRVPRLALACAAALAAAALSGCGNVGALTPDLSLSRLKETVAPRDLNLFQRREPLTTRQITADELMTADGRCASDAPAVPSAALNFSAGPQAPNAPTPEKETASPEGPAHQSLVRGVGLGMTECEVVRAIGHTDRIELSTNERGQRALALTYLSGPRPGIYRFVSGRLVSIERGPEPPAPEKPAKPKKKTKATS